MAQLKDLIVTGATRLIGDAFVNKIQITSISAPTSAGGTTYGLGTNGYVLKTNGSSVYWAADTNSLTGVKGNAESSYRTGNVNLTPANIHGTGTTGQFWRGDNTWSNTLTDKLTVYNSGTGESNGNSYTGGLEVREYKCQTTTLDDTYKNAPGITFHWGGHVVNKLNMRKDGALYWGETKVVTNSGSWGISITGSSASCTGNSATASALTNIASSDAASSTATQRRIWFSYDNNTTGRPAYDDNFTYQTSTKTLSINNIKITRSFKNLITGTGTAASDAGSGDNRYKPAKWTFNTGANAADGEIFTIKIPIAGHDYGVFMSVNNGTNYYPVVANGTGRITTHYPVDTYLQVIFESTGSAASMFPLAGGTARVTVSGGVFRVINYYDSNSNDTGYYHRKIYPNLKAGSNKIHPYTLIMENKDGRWESLISTNPGTGSSHAANTHGFLLGNVYCMYANATYNENATVATYNIWSAHSGLIDVRYSFNLTSSAGITGYKPVYIVGTIGTDGLFYLDTTKWWAQDLPTTDDGKVYVYIGDGYDWYRMTLSEVNPAYFYRDSRIQMYAPGRGIKTITRSGTTFTATRDDGSTFTFTQQDNNSVTGVKGNAESSYRTGQVNLTPANIGAAAASHTHYELATIGDQRSTATTPNTYANRLIFQGLKTNSAFGSPSSDTYSYVVGLRGWSDSSGGNSHELAFNNTGIYHRSGATTSWGNWIQLVENTGTWGISITGNAATATTATTASTCSGNAATATKLATSRTISLTGSVTGSGSFDGSGNLSIATTTNHNHKTLTVGNKTYNGSSDVTIEIADLGLASTTTFIGLTSTNLSNGSTTNPVTITVGPTTGSVTATNGNVVMEADSGEEYIWSGNKWNLMGLASSWALANHIHGNITNAGTITADTAVANSQHLVITDSNNKVSRSSLTIDTSKTSEYLTHAGTWATPPNNAVTITNTTSNATYDVLFSSSTTTTTNKTEGARKTTNFTFNPSTKTLTVNGGTVVATTFSGNATSATKATKDGDNNTISSTYLKLSGGTMTGALTIKGLKATSGTDYGTTLPQTGTTGQVFFQLSDPYYELPSGGTTGQFLRGDRTWSNTLTDNLVITGPYQKLLLKSSQHTKGVTPSETLFQSILFTDTSGNFDHAGGRDAMLESFVDTTNKSTIVMAAYQVSQANSSNRCEIYCDANADGSVKAGANAPFWGAVWNDYAECREIKENIEPGRCVKEVGDDSMILTTERLQRGCEIISDTFGFCIGETETAKTPTATSGRVLAYLYEDREFARSHIGWPVCSGPNGTVSIMTEEEEEKYPSRIIGTISSVPDYEIWHAGTQKGLNQEEIKVNGRVWIRVR